MQILSRFTAAASGGLLWFALAVSLHLPAALAADDLPIPSLPWTPRSDSLNVKDVGAAGDGKTDDTAAIQKALSHENRAEDTLKASDLHQLVPALDDLRRLGEVDLTLNHSGDK